MALTTPRGFAGGPMADIDYGMASASSAWVETAAALAVTQPNSGVRTVSIAAGTAVAFGVRVTNDAALTQPLTAPSSGSQWYLLALRFSWSAKTVTLVSLTGPSSGGTTVPNGAPTSVPGGFSTTPGGTVDLPLAWALVTSGNTLVVVYDLRIRSSGADGLVAISIHALAFANLWLFSNGAVVSLDTFTALSGQIHAGSLWQRINGVMTARGRILTSGTVTLAGLLADLRSLIQAYSPQVALEVGPDTQGARIAISAPAMDYGWNGSDWTWVGGGGVAGVPGVLISLDSSTVNSGSGKSTHIRRSGRQITLVVNVNITAAKTTSGLLMAVPAPAESTNFDLTLYGPSNGYQGGRATVEISSSDGGIRIAWASQTLAANTQFFGQVTYIAADGN